VEGDDLAESLLTLPVRVLSFCSSLERSRGLMGQAPAVRAASVGTRVDVHRGDLLVGLLEVRSLANRLWAPYHVPVLAEEAAGCVSKASTNKRAKE